MKYSIVFLIFGFIFVVHCRASLYSRGCIYSPFGECISECPEGTNSYVSSCEAPTWSEKTCDEPIARDIGAICDLSRCECDPPTIKDKKSGKCVKPEDCPKE